MSVQEVASRLKCHPHTVRRWIWGGRIAAVKVGDLVRVQVAELDRFVRPLKEREPAARRTRSSRKKGFRALLETMRKLRGTIRSADVEEMERMMSEAEQPAEWRSPLG